MVKTNRNVIKDSFVVPEEIDVKERTAFMGAAAAAHKAGKKSFSFGGKTHPVTMKKDTAAAVSDSTDPWADMDLDAIELDEDPFHDVPSRPQWITDAYNEMNEDDDNKMFVLRKQARVNQRRIDKGMKPVTPLHPDHKNLIKPKNKKVGMSEKSSVNYKDIDGKTVNEISKDLATAYLKGRGRDLYFTGKKAGQDDIKAMVGAPTPSYKKGPERKASMMMRSMDRALGKLTGKAKVPAQGKKGKNVRDQY